MPGTRTTQNVGPVLGTCYPVDVTLVADEVNLWERNAKLIVYKKTLGQGKFEAVISDAEARRRFSNGARKEKKKKERKGGEGGEGRDSWDLNQAVKHVCDSYE